VRADEPRLDYDAAAAAHRPTAATWDGFVRHALVGQWVETYKRQTLWDVELLEIGIGGLTYLFDAAPTTTKADEGEDRTVAVWGHSRPPGGKRDAARQSRFLPQPAVWSKAGRDRGHLVAHAAGGSMDINLFPQAMALNRGTSTRGRIWRSMERYGADHPGTPLYLRALYSGPTWVPHAIEYGLLRSGRVWHERFENRG
jgi:hypothetical protein